MAKESKKAKTMREKEEYQARKRHKVALFEATLPEYAREIYNVLVEEREVDPEKFVAYLPELKHSAIDPNDGELKYWDCFKVKGTKNILAISDGFDKWYTTINGMISRDVTFVRHGKY